MPSKQGHSACLSVCRSVYHTLDLYQNAQNIPSNIHNFCLSHQKTMQLSENSLPGTMPLGWYAQGTLWGK